MKVSRLRPVYIGRLVEALDLVKAKLHVSDNTIAQTCNMSKATISKWRQCADAQEGGDALCSAIVSLYKAYPIFNANYIITGEGELSSTETLAEKDAKIAAMSEEIASLKSTVSEQEKKLSALLRVLSEYVATK